MGWYLVCIKGTPRKVLRFAWNGEKFDQNKKGFFDVKLRLFLQDWRMKCEGWRVKKESEGWRLNAEGWTMKSEGWRLNDDGCWMRCEVGEGRVDIFWWTIFFLKFSDIKQHLYLRRIKKNWFFVIWFIYICIYFFFGGWGVGGKHFVKNFCHTILEESRKTDFIFGEHFGWGFVTTWK